MSEHIENGTGKVNYKAVSASLAFLIVSLVVYIFLTTVQRIDAKDLTQDNSLQNQQAQITKMNQTITEINAQLTNIDGSVSRIEKKLNLQ